jgi:hypothetical protein
MSTAVQAVWAIPETPGLPMITAAQAVGKTVNTRPNHGHGSPSSGQYSNHEALPLPRQSRIIMATETLIVGTAIPHYSNGSPSSGQCRKHQASSWLRQPKQWAIPETPSLIMATATEAVGKTVNTKPHHDHGGPRSGQYPRPHYGHGSAGCGQHSNRDALQLPRQSHLIMATEA